MKMKITRKCTRVGVVAGFDMENRSRQPGDFGRSPSTQGSGMLVRIVQISGLMTLVLGCVEPSAHQESPQASAATVTVKATPPLLPISISDVLQLPDIAIDEADGIGPGLRYWHLITNRGFPYIYAEAYDEPFLTKLTVTVYASEPGTIGDHLKIIHDTFCRLRPDDPWFMTTWPESGANGFSLPASAVHDGLVLDISREEKWTTLTVTATAPNPEDDK
jgi:hypothetical protein